ncbi:hypothetical protein MFIFM68171_02338 [Madurella fahalii]|uniref:Uncharacterized protein n=1 Tax=Madurella fahalii TaxID=1157608 RepID=A0ABQ0G2Y3_9PEZI
MAPIDGHVPITLRSPKGRFRGGGGGGGSGSSSDSDQQLRKILLIIGVVVAGFVVLVITVTIYRHYLHEARKKSGVTKLKALWKTFRVITLLYFAEILIKDLFRSIKSRWKRRRGSSTQQETPEELRDNVNTAHHVEMLPPTPAPARLA